MTKSTTQQREDSILEAIWRHGYIMQDGRGIISFWDLAHHLNNVWDAYLFVSRQYADPRYGLEHPRYALPSHALWHYRAPIERTCRESEKLLWVPQREFDRHADHVHTFSPFPQTQS